MRSAISVMSVVSVSSFEETPHQKKKVPPIECKEPAVLIVMRSVISVVSVVSVSSVEETPHQKKRIPQLSVMSVESVNSVEETRKKMGSPN